MPIKGFRKTHCVHGHEYTPANTLFYGSIRRCRICHNKTEVMREQKYGLTPERYKEMYDSQGGLCALGCGRPIQCVDHCHDTEATRELLCKKCNSALGFLNDDPMLMIRASEYVVRHRAMFNIRRK
jgi:hypothetical protein